MSDETLSARLAITAPAHTIFTVLADPSKHPSIDGTGWVCEPLDRERLTASAQVFRMVMYHPNHPNGNYEMANRVELFNPPEAISWRPGYDPGDGNLQFGGWVWRYDLNPIGSSDTEVTLTYDWSGVPEDIRQRIGFPPFSVEHLNNSLAHLRDLVEAARSPGERDCA